MSEKENSVEIDFKNYSVIGVNVKRNEDGLLFIYVCLVDINKNGNPFIFILNYNKEDLLKIIDQLCLED